MNVAIPNVIELCAGYGGIGLGLTLALGEVRNLVFVEREISVARVLVARFQDGSLAPADIWSDVKTFDGRPYQGKTDILCAGYPCQPFSCAGKQLAHKDPRHLWPHVARIIREVQPEQVFLENVDAHLRLGFHEVADELERMGYRIACGLFSAEEVGAPHRRLRLFALAERTGGRRGVLRESSGIDGLPDGRGAELDNADSEPRRRDETTAKPHRKQSQNGNVGAASAGVADSGNGLLPLTRRGSQGRTGAGSAGADVADSERLPLVAQREQGVEEGSRLGRYQLIRGRGAVADARGGRSPIGSNGQGGEEERAASLRSGIPLFPPGPADFEAWSRLRMLCPDAEPAVCRAAHERTDRLHGCRQSSRVSRLRALGNGVVPMVAAFAYTTLRAELDS